MLKSASGEGTRWGVEDPHPRSVDAITGSARLEGTQVGLDAVEGFQLIRDEPGLI